jgi:hypothetical protein
MAHTLEKLMRIMPAPKTPVAARGGASNHFSSRHRAPK